MRIPKKLATWLSDECVPKLVNEFLERNSIEVIRVEDLKLVSRPDEDIFQKAHALRVPILTLDVRFAGQVYRKPSYIYGLILLRYKGRVSELLLESIKNFIQNEGSRKLRNTVVVIDEQKYRISKKPKHVVYSN